MVGQGSLDLAIIALKQILKEVAGASRKQRHAIGQEDLPFELKDIKIPETVPIRGADGKPRRVKFDALTRSEFELLLDRKRRSVREDEINIAEFEKLFLYVREYFVDGVTFHDALKEAKRRGQEG